MSEKIRFFCWFPCWHLLLMASLPPHRVSADDREMEHAARALDVLWRSFPPELLLYNESDTRDLMFETSLQQSGLLPCILVNIGSAMTIVMVRMFRLFFYIGPTMNLR